MPILDREGVKLFYEISGTVSDRAPVLLTHGYSATSEMWEPNVNALGAQRRVITWDMRGHGRSDLPEDGSLYSEELSVADMAAKVPAATKVVIEGAGHASNIDRPEAFNRTEFLERL